MVDERRECFAVRKLERVSFCIELKFLNGKCTFVQRERNASGRRYTLVFSMIYDSVQFLLNGESGTL